MRFGEKEIVNLAFGNKQNLKVYFGEKEIIIQQYISIEDTFGYYGDPGKVYTAYIDSTQSENRLVDEHWQVRLSGGFKVYDTEGELIFSGLNSRQTDTWDTARLWVTNLDSTQRHFVKFTNEGEYITTGTQIYNHIKLVISDEEFEPGTIIEAPVCEADDDGTPDIYIKNNNSFTVNVQWSPVDEVNFLPLATLEGYGDGWFGEDIFEFETDYFIRFEYNGSYSQVVTANTGCDDCGCDCDDCDCDDACDCDCDDCGCDGCDECDGECEEDCICDDCDYCDCDDDCACDEEEA